MADNINKDKTAGQPSSENKQHEKKEAGTSWESLMEEPAAKTSQGDGGAAAARAATTTAQALTIAEAARAAWDRIRAAEARKPKQPPTDPEDPAYLAKAAARHEEKKDRRRERAAAVERARGSDKKTSTEE